jgi:cellulose synthase/poly-beta-1,6-N-acetylglucosamine synthase-like glycosyltransferase
MIVLDLLLAIVALPVLAAAIYLFVLAVAARAPKEEAIDEAPPRIRFDVVVPAHDEEAGITATVQSLAAVDYPAHLRRIIVVADNCSDATAARAAAAGAAVLVRDEPLRRGKGYALARAFARVEGDAVVVVDADTEVSPNLLRAFARRFEAGAHAAQVSYGVRNPSASWRTRLLVIALALFHDLRSLGRERLHLSAGLRGNGMAFSRALLELVPYDAFSIVEDVEHGIRLGEAGVRVAYVPEAHVRGEMVSRTDRARSQRRRWEQGRAALARARGPELLVESFRQRDPVLLDLALDLVVPPLATLVLAAVAGVAASLALHALGGSMWPAIPWLLSAALLAFYVLRGWALSGVGARGLVDLVVFAPAYVVWKIALSLGRAEHRRGEWVRTAREAHHGP